MSGSVNEISKKMLGMDIDKIGAQSLGLSLIPAVPDQFLIKYNPPKIWVVYHFKGHNAKDQYWRDIPLEIEDKSTVASVTDFLFKEHCYYFDSSLVGQDQVKRLISMIFQKSRKQGEERKNNIMDNVNKVGGTKNNIMDQVSNTAATKNNILDPVSKIGGTNKNNIMDNVGNLPAKNNIMDAVNKPESKNNIMGNVEKVANVNTNITGTETAETKPKKGFNRLLNDINRAHEFNPDIADPFNKNSALEPIKNDPK